MNTSLQAIAAAAVVVVLALGGAAVYFLGATGAVGGTSPSTASSGSCCSTDLLRIGYFANINHAQALVGLFNGDYQRELGDSVRIELSLFNAGPTEMVALLAGKLDMGYVGPSPSVNAFIQSNGTGLRIVAGASNGGALFVVTNASGIGTASSGDVTSQLAGKTFLGPQHGNTQDVALRAYLLSHHLVPGVNVTVQDTSNANIVNALIGNKADGAWVPQPYASLILSQAAAHVFLDERSLWPGGDFSTAELVVSTPFLAEHPDVVERVVTAHVKETLWINSHLSEAATVMNATIVRETGIGISPRVLTSALSTLSFTYDPLASSVRQQAQQAYDLGFLGSAPPNLQGLIDATVLNHVLLEQGLPEVQS